MDNGISSWVSSNQSIKKADVLLHNIKGIQSTLAPRKALQQPWLLKSVSRKELCTKFARMSLYNIATVNNPVVFNCMNVFDVISMACSDRFDLEYLDTTLLPRLYELLSEREGLLPMTESTFTIHQLVHVFQDIKKIGPPRFYWMYGAERLNKYLKGLLKN